MFERTKAAAKKFLGQETQIKGETLSANGVSAADLIEESRPLTREEQQFVVRCGQRAAGGQKILNLLARGTRVQKHHQANIRLGQFSGLY